MKNIALYDVVPIRDLRDMVRKSAQTHADKPVFLVKDPRATRIQPAGQNDAYQPVSYRQFSQDIDAFGTRLKQLGIEGLRVAILAETRYEWYVTYLATTNGAGVIVPLDKELPPNEIASLLQRSGAQVLVYASSKRDVVAAVRKDLPALHHLVCMDEPDAEAGADSFWNWLEAGAATLQGGDNTFIDAEINPDILSVLLFTSGTTAKSKAVMLSHKNICSNLEGMCQMTKIVADDVFLSVLPLHHTYECTCGFLCPVYRGATVAVCEGLRHITKNLQEAKATILLVVPLMLELFHKRIMKSATADPALARKFRFGLALSRLMRKLGIDKRRSLFSRIHETFGGHLRLLISGGAAIDPQIMTGLQDLGLDCIQGYGLTECAPILALNRDIDFKNEAAGLPLPGVDMKIIDHDENGIGEIVGRGPNIMLGYFENEEATREAIDEEGFFHTGDLGYIDADGFVIITGRKKNVIVTKNGKNIFPEEIEFLLNRSDYIQECLVTGIQDEDGETVVAAEIFPNMEAVEAKINVADPAADQVRTLIAEEVRDINHQLAPYKYIRSFTLRTTEFAKTTSKKIKRNI